MTTPLPPAQTDHLSHPKYRADIDGLRAIAIILVIAFHAFPDWVKGGFIGVDIFFVISGYLISTIMIGSLERRSFSFVEFYIRRINRIFPALVLVLAASFVFGWFVLLAEEYKQLGKHVAGGAGFISNFLLWNESGYFDNATETKPLLHLWSLGVEEQFYILWPLLLWFAWKRRLNLLTIAIVVGIFSFALNVGKVRSDTVAAFYSPQTRFWELMAGSVLAYMVRHKQDMFSQFKLLLDTWLRKAFYAREPVQIKTLRNFQSLIGAALIVLGILVITKERHFPGWWAVLPILGAVLIIAAGAEAWLNRAVLSNRVLVWFGLISFPLYLWHWPLLSFAHIIKGETPEYLIRITAVLASVVLAWLTYKLIEQPVRFGKHSQGKTIVLISLMIVVGYMGYNDYRQDGIKDRKVVLNNFDPDENIPLPSNSSPCTSEAKYSLVSKFCTKYEVNNPQKKIVLWGDSSSGAWASVFLEISKSKQYSVVLISHPNCAPLLNADGIKHQFESLESDDIKSANYCSQGKMQEQAVELMKAIKPDVTVVIAAWNWRNTQCKNEETSHPARSTRPLDKDLRRTISELEKSSKVIVFKSWPLLPSNPNYEIARIPFLKIPHKETVVGTNEFTNANGCINNIFDSIPTSHTTFFDPSQKMCSEKCVSILNRVKMYVDSYHISPQGSMQFRNEIDKLL